MKFVLLLAFAVFARSAPLDNEVTSSFSQKDAADDKANSTDSGSASPKSTRFYPYAPMAYNSYPSTPLSYGYNQFSSPLMYPQPASYGYSSAAMLPYSYGSAFPYMRDNSLPSNAKTIGHLRGLQSPLLYNAQPQIYAQPQVYALPAVSSYSQHAYQPYAYSGYPSAYYGSYGYDSYSPLYRRSADDVEITAHSQPSLQPTVNYQTKYIVEQPEYVKDQPQVIQYQPGMSETSPRAVSLDQHPNIVAYDVIPTNAGLNQLNHLEAFRGNDVVLDDKMQLKVSPQYLMNRYHAQAPTPFSRAAGDEPQFGAYQGPTDPEDKVFIEFNQYSGNQPESNAQVMQPIAKAVDETAYYPANSQNWGYNYAASIPVAGAGQGNLPFSAESIRMAMERYYEEQYRRSIEEYKRLNQNKLKERNVDDLPGFGKELEAIRKEKMWKSENSPNNKPGKNQEVPEIPKAENPKNKD